MKQAFSILLGAIALAAPMGVMAQDNLKPQILQASVQGTNGSFYSISDNGKWVVGWAQADHDASLWGHSTLIDAETGEIISLVPAGQESVINCANDVTDAGDVVGAWENQCAIWRKATGKWTVLPVPELPKGYKYVETDLGSVTPDGKYAVGMTWSNAPKEPWQDYYNLKAIAYKFDEQGNGTMIELKENFERFSTVLPGGIGPTERGLYNLETGELKPYPDGAHMGAAFSPNGKLMVCGAEFDDQGFQMGAMTVYNLETGEKTVIEDNSPANNILIVGISDNGVIFGSSETTLMFRNWWVHVGKYWYDIRLILRDIYGIDWENEYAKTDWGLSGTFWGTSGDGRVQATMDNTKTPWAGYIFRMPEDYQDICGRIDLLQNRYAFPNDGASFSRLANITITFDRPVVPIMTADKVSVLDEQGQLVKNAVRFDVNPGNKSVMEISFRNITLEEGKKYSVVIPAGAIGVEGDTERTNTEIRLTYTGRPNTPVAPVKVAPEAGNTLQTIDMNANPIVVTFDANLSVVENPDNEVRMNLWQVGADGEPDRIMSALAGSVDGNVVTIYPVLEQRLANGKDFKVVINAGTFADLSGANPNEEIVINYKGGYKPNIDPVPFTDDFDNGFNMQKWMYFDGDNNEPTDEMKAWGFTADYPWFMVKEDNMQKGWSAVSHSMYRPLGKSDDWMVTCPIYIADDTYKLTFLSQSYLKDKNDVLKVYVWVSDDIINQLNTSRVAQIRNEGKIVYEKKQEPGESQELLSGEWMDNEVDLSEYAGKFIYIAFLNENTNQSAIFLDDVNVSRELTLSMASTTPETVFGVESVEVTGSVDNLSRDTYNGVELVLKDGEGTEVDKLVIDKTLAPGESEDFKFAKALPLVKGEMNDFRIELKSGELNNSINGTVKALSFQTTKRVLLEENTGTNCQFCPSGHVTIERLEQDFGDKFVPVAIHGYTGGSMFSNTATMPYAQFLGANGAPTARVDRLDGVLSAMGDGWKIIHAAGGTWYDVVAKQLQKNADADIVINSVEVGEEKTTIDAEVQYAFNCSDMNLNILTIVLEDNLNGKQNNVFAAYSPEEAGDMKDWARGGKYGDSEPRFTFTNVFRGLANNSRFNGEPGFLPSTIKADEVYPVKFEMATPADVKRRENVHIVMAIIDANTGRVVNCATSKKTEDSVEGITESADAVVYVTDGAVRVYCPGDFHADVYSIDGTALASADARDEAEFVTGRKGIVIVRVVKDGRTSVSKLAL